MDNRMERRARLQLPAPYLLFYPPANARVEAHVHNPAGQVPVPNVAWQNGLWELDYGVPPAFTVQGVAQKQAGSIVIDGQGTPKIAPDGREDEYLHQYAWAAFAPALQGDTVPRGKEDAIAAMLPVNVDPDNLSVLRFRWRGTVAVGVADNGTGVAGPYTFDIPALLGGPIGGGIVPGTVKIGGPGGETLLDVPWFRGENKPRCVVGKIGGDIDPAVDSTINYETGEIVATFNAVIPVGVGNISLDFEYDWVPTPLDIHVAWDSLSQ